MGLDTILSAVLTGIMFVLIIYAMYWAIKITGRILRATRDAVRNPEEAIRKTGAVTGALAGKATDITKSAKDAFVDGYKNKR